MDDDSEICLRNPNESIISRLDFLDSKSLTTLIEAVLFCYKHKAIKHTHASLNN